MFLSSFLLLKNPDVTAVSHGNFQSVYGNAYITRANKQLISLDVVIRVNGAKYRLLTQYRLYGTNRLQGLDLNNPNSIPNTPTNP
jgi:hypothetical protein